MIYREREIIENMIIENLSYRECDFRKLKKILDNLVFCVLDNRCILDNKYIKNFLYKKFWFFRR